MDLTDEQWLLLQPLIAPHLPAGNLLGGRPPIDERRVLDGIFWKLRNNAPWYDLPSSYPSHQTCYRRYRQWQRLGLLDAILQALYQDYLDRGGVDIQQLIQDGHISIKHESGIYRCYIASRLCESSQLPILLLFLGLIIKRLKAASPLTTA